jgi:predicted RNA-binding protein with PUA-like domain
MKYWLIKSEPEAFSIQDLEDSPDQITHWDGIRNYQARNFMRDDMKIGDKLLFYHSNCKEIGVVGVAEVVKESYPDHTAWDSNSKYYDSKSTPDNPRWFMVDVKLVEKFKRTVTLKEIKNEPKLADMKLVQKGVRLSVQPVTKEEFQHIAKMAKQ